MIAPPEKIPRLAHGERSLFGVSVIVCLTLFALAGALFVSRERANVAETRTETVAVAAALEAARDSFAEEMRLRAERLPQPMAQARLQAIEPVRLADDAYMVDLARDLPPAHGVDADWAD
ncbi:MAG: hypothetical protein KDJ44_16820, partial [Rhodoblastus sp.]|nr:hypothetical protein [Rhodoblastus sp.]